MLAAKIIRDKSTTLYIVKYGFGLESRITNFNSIFGNPSSKEALNLDAFISNAQLIEEINRVGCLEINDENLLSQLIVSNTQQSDFMIQVYDVRE